MVEFLLQDNSSLKPWFIWGNDKCDVTRSKHPSNPNRELVLNFLSKVLFDISPRFRELIPSNTLLIDQYPYKCVGNVPYIYISYPIHLI